MKKGHILMLLTINSALFKMLVSNRISLKLFELEANWRNVEEERKKM